MTSLLLLNNQVCAIYSRLFINFALVIVMKFISAHIQNNARHYGMVFIFCSMLRSFRVTSGVSRCWSRPLGSWSQQPMQQELTPELDLNHRIIRNTMQQDIENQSTCHWSIRYHHQRPIYLCMHVCAWLEKTWVYCWVEHTWFQRTIYTTLLAHQTEQNGQPITRNVYWCDTSWSSDAY